MTETTNSPTTPALLAVTDIRVGQIWREVDPRFDRHVRVKLVGNGRRSIAIQTCVPNGSGGWKEAARSRTRWADRERFDGKRGNYQFVSGDFK